ncbi:hypothetical protein D3C78_1370060 [compost metagenome]
MPGAVFTPGFKHIAQKIHVAIKMRGEDKIPVKLSGQVRAFDTCAQQESFCRDGGKRCRLHGVLLRVASR